MATNFGIVVNYGEQKETLYVVGSATIDYTIKKAAACFEIDKERRPSLVLVHQGTRLPKESLVKDALKNSTTTCCFLQSSTTVVDSLNSSLVNSREDVGGYHGFCSTCKAIGRVRPVYSCRKCKQNTFMMDQRINLFEEDPDHCSGTCTSCKAQVKPDISYQCAVSVDTQSIHSAIFLPHLRRNDQDLPCMKCRDKCPHVIRFSCNHTMCLQCFSDMCKMQLDVGGFRNYPNLGYSICCPAKSGDCLPIADPHHFYLVDNTKDFYKKFQDKSFHVFQEQEKENRHVKCQKCHRNLDMSQVQEVEVEPPSSGAAAIPQESANHSGSFWTSVFRLFRRTQSQPQTASLIRRQQVKCSGCQTKYCAECKVPWHVGDCIKMSADQQAAENEFKIDSANAQASLWK